MEIKNFPEFSSTVKRYIGKNTKTYRQLVYAQFKDFPGSYKEAFDSAKTKCGVRFGSYVNFFKHLSQGDGSLKNTIAIHFVFHMEEKWNYYAEQIDVQLFGNDLNAPDLFWRVKTGLVSANAPSSHANIEEGNNAWPYLRLPATPDTDDNETWLNPLNHKAIALFGREKQLAVLSDFLHSELNFSILAVIGPSGAGKTRLVSEWLLSKVEHTKWRAGFIVDRDISIWKSWHPTQDTVIVIDYIFQFHHIIREIVAKCLQTKNHKTRLIIVDHIFPSALRELWRDPYLSSLVKTRSEADTSGMLFHRDSPIVLSDAPNRREILIDIVSHISGLQKESIETKTALMQLEEMGDAASHPLFAALMGEALKAKRNTRAWFRSDLLAYYLESRNRLPWLQQDGDNEEPSLNGYCVGAFVSAATVRRGMSIPLLIANSPNKMLKTDENLRKIIARCFRTAGVSKPIITNADLPPFEPDILGQLFFIRFCQEFIFDDIRRNWFAEILSATDEKSQFNLHNFIVFFHRLAFNLANDNQIDISIQAAWDAVCRFLNPRNFLQFPILQKAISFAIPYVADQAYRAGQISSTRQLLSHISPLEMLMIVVKEKTLSAGMSFDALVHHHALSYCVKIYRNPGPYLTDEELEGVRELGVSPDDIKCILS